MTDDLELWMKSAEWRGEVTQILKGNSAKIDSNTACVKIIRDKCESIEDRLQVLEIEYKHKIKRTAILVGAISAIVAGTVTGIITHLILNAV